MASELSVAIVSFFVLFGATNVTSTLLRLRYRPLRENAGELVRTGLAYVVIALPSAVLAGFVAPGTVGPVSGILGVVTSLSARFSGAVSASPILTRLTTTTY